MESHGRSPERAKDIEGAVDDLIEEASKEGLPTSEIKLRLRLTSEKVVEKSIEHKGRIAFFAGVTGLTVGSFVAARQIRKRKK